MAASVIETEFKVKGRVQMVMFRDFARRKALELKLTGSVKNNEDGSVTVVAQGQDESLERLEEYLKKGPLFAKVAEISKKRKTPEKTYSDFEIIY